MKFLVKDTVIEIVAVYSWFDIYVNNTMILHHISQEDADSLINTIIKANGKQIAKRSCEK